MKRILKKINKKVKKLNEEIESLNFILEHPDYAKIFPIIMIDGTEVIIGVDNKAKFYNPGSKDYVTIVDGYYAIKPIDCDFCNLIIQDGRWRLEK